MTPSRRHHPLSELCQHRFNNHVEGDAEKPDWVSDGIRPPKHPFDVQFHDLRSMNVAAERRVCDDLVQVKQELVTDEIPRLVSSAKTNLP